MNRLHIVNTGNLANCARTVSEGDAILLVEDGVLLATDRQACQLLIDTSCSLFVLAPHLARRGVEALVSGVTPIDFEKFVALTEQYHPIISWSS